MAAPLCLRSGRAFHRAQDRHVGPATTLDAGQRLADLLVARLRGVAQERRGGQHPAREAVAALRHLLGDVRRLQRMGSVRRAQPVQGGALLALDAAHGRAAAARRPTPRRWTSPGPPWWLYRAAG